MVAQSIDYVISARWRLLTPQIEQIEITNRKYYKKPIGLRLLRASDHKWKRHILELPIEESTEKKINKNIVRTSKIHVGK